MTGWLVLSIRERDYGHVREPQARFYPREEEQAARAWAQKAADNNGEAWVINVEQFLPRPVTAE